MDYILSSLYNYGLMGLDMLLAGTTGDDLTEVVNEIGNYSEGSSGTMSDAVTKVGNISTGAYAIVVKVGLAIAIIGVVVVGIMFILNSGGAGKQENKGRLVNTLLGVLFIGAAVGIVSFMITAGAQLFATD